MSLINNTISAGDANRIATIIRLAMQDEMTKCASKQGTSGIWRAERAEEAVQRICATLGLTVDPLR